MSRIQIFGGDGYKLADIVANAPRSWMVGKYGRCEFTIPVISAKCREQYLNFGNYVLIEHPSLPPWGGMIDTPRIWGNNKVKTTAYTPEYILNYRTVGYDSLKLTPGAMFSRLIDIANKIDDTRLFKGGPIDETGSTMKFNPRFENMYKYIKDKIGDAGYEWRIYPILENNRLFFEATLYEKFINKLDFTLSEGINVEANDGTLTEDGFVYSVLTGIGKGASWGTRYKYRAENSESGAKYRYREQAIEINEDDESAVEEYTDKQLAKESKPRKKFDLSATDVNDTFKQLNLGNVLHVNLSVCGFNGDKLGTQADVRITEMAYDESKETVRLILEEYNDDTE